MGFRRKPAALYALKSVSQKNRHCNFQVFPKGLSEILIPIAHDGQARISGLNFLK